MKEYSRKLWKYLIFSLTVFRQILYFSWSFSTGLLSRVCSQEVSDLQIRSHCCLSKLQQNLRQLHKKTLSVHALCPSVDVLSPWAKEDRRDIQLPDLLEIDPVTVSPQWSLRRITGKIHFPADTTIAQIGNSRKIVDFLHRAAGIFRYLFDLPEQKTPDALFSRRDREKKLGILKDTHTGAFAVIFGGLYLILYAAACTELDEGSALLTAIGFILSRALSGLSTATFPEARKHGMLADFMKDARKKTVAVCMLVIFFLAAFLELLFGGICGDVVVITTVLIFLWYRHMAVQEFGGVTGDLAGFFLQICELGILLAAVIGKAVF